jgi:cellulose synthase/poly-beta-1,6-N-acetylglucosamine synthase-like glycosyltransferase
VFVQRDLLVTAGGWDPNCLAEDCELGVRLSTLGAEVAVAYDSELATREETPGSLSGLFRQRTRWNQGFLQVLRKGDWRQLPTRRQRWLARYTLSMPFMQAATGLLLPISVITMLWAHLPVVFALVSFLPALPTLGTLAFEIAGLHEFCHLYGLRTRGTDYVRLVLGVLPYQVVLSAAAVRAVIRESRGVRTWEKTTHLGAHRIDSDIGAETTTAFAP